MSTRVTRSATIKQKATPPKEPVQLSSPPPTPGIPITKKRKVSQAKNNATFSPTKLATAAPNSSRKRARPSAVKNEDANELPHNLGVIPDLAPATLQSAKNSLKRPRKAVVKNSDDDEALSVTDNVDKVVAKATQSPQKSPKKKNNMYGLTPGQTPYPNWPHPTPEECHEVNRLLASVHGEVKAPKTIPMPSLTVSGCGEVPSVLDALIRTRLSAATSGTNSSRAFAGLVSKFGILQSGIGKGSVDWNKVRLADTKEVFEAIKSGGLADVKSKDFKKILQMVWEENQGRRKELLSNQQAAPGSANESLGEKNAEVARAEEDVLSLDHLHLLSNDDAFNALVKYPGIGPKTASCVLLFCLQRPSFAVDTHVFRLSKWLGWIPPPGDPAGLTPNASGSSARGKFAGPTRNSTYAHLEVRIPDDLKYPLHQLFIKHGKTCPRCRAITGESSEGWDEGCVIDHLVQRSGVRKSAPTKKSKKVAKTSKIYDDDSEAGTELSDMGSDDEDEDEP